MNPNHLERPHSPFGRLAPRRLAGVPGGEPLNLTTLPLHHVAGRQRADAQPIVTRLPAEASPLARLQPEFDLLLSRDSLLNDVVARLGASGLRFGVLGGWVRDHLVAQLDPRSPPPQDIDLVVADTTHEAIAKLMPRPLARTAFGGFTFAGPRIGIDLWASNDTFLTRRLGLPCDVAHVLAVTDFNINAIIFLPTQAWTAPAVLDAGALHSLETRTISFHFETIALPIAQVARLLVFALRLGFAFDDAVAAFIRENGAEHANQKAIQQNLAAHYPDSMVDAAMRLLHSVLSGGPRTP